MQLRPCFRGAYKRPLSPHPSVSILSSNTSTKVIVFLHQDHLISLQGSLSLSLLQRQTLCLAPPRPVNLLYIYRGFLQLLLNLPSPRYRSIQHPTLSSVINPAINSTCRTKSTSQIPPCPAVAAAPAVTKLWSSPTCEVCMHV